jgi:hypothetical protein
MWKKSQIGHFAKTTSSFLVLNLRSTLSSLRLQPATKVKKTRRRTQPTHPQKIPIQSGLPAPALPRRPPNTSTVFDSLPCRRTLLPRASVRPSKNLWRRSFLQHVEGHDTRGGTARLGLSGAARSTSDLDAPPSSVRRSPLSHQPLG